MSRKPRESNTSWLLSGNSGDFLPHAGGGGNIGEEQRRRVKTTSPSPTRGKLVRVRACVCVRLSASLGAVTHTASVQWGGGGGVGQSGGARGSVAISVELIPQPVTGLSAAVIHTHTYEHWSH